MRGRKVSRRNVLGASTVLAVGAVFPERLKSGVPEATAVNPAMIQAARKEGMIAFYTAMEIPIAEDLGKMFEAKYPSIAVHVKRSEAERVFQRIGKEEAIQIYEVDVVCSTDAAHFIHWKRDGLLAPYLPEEAAKHLPAEQVDADAMYATAFALLSPIGYNTSIVKPDDAPKSFADLLDPRWNGKIVKGNPNYSGTIFTATFQLARPRLVLFREARPTEGHASTVGARSTKEASAWRERGTSRRCRTEPAAIKGTACARRGCLCDRGHAADHCSERCFHERTKSECCTLVPEFPFQHRGTAVPGQCLRFVLIPCPCEGKARTSIAVRDQAAEKRSIGHGDAERRNQSALQQDFRGVNAAVPDRLRWGTPAIYKFHRA
jgi:hypothetical protein